MDLTAVAVACIAAFAAILAGYFSFRAAQQTKTTNGHSTGELAESINERLARIEAWTIEHLRDHVDWKK